MPDDEEKPPAVDLVNDPRVQELRVALLLNLALGHLKLKQYRHTVSYCDEALLDQPNNVKALYRKADALGELCNWKEAEEAVAKLEDTGEEGRTLARKKKDEWKRRRKASDGKQKKMWSAALKEEASKKESADKDKENEKPPEQPPAQTQAAAPKKPEVQERWVPPKVEATS